MMDHPNKNQGGSVKDFVEALDARNEAAKSSRYSYTMSEVLGYYTRLAYDNGVNPIHALNHIKLSAPLVYKKISDRTGDFDQEFIKDYLSLVRNECHSVPVAHKKKVIRYFYSLYEDLTQIDETFKFNFITEVINITSGHRHLSKLTTELVEELTQLSNGMVSEQIDSNTFNFYNMKTLVEDTGFYTAYPIFTKEQKAKMNSMVADWYIQWSDSMEHIDYITDLLASYSSCSLPDSLVRFREDLVEYVLTEIENEYNKKKENVPYDLFFDIMISEIAMRFKNQRADWGWYTNHWTGFYMPYVLSPDFYKDAPKLSDKYWLLDYVMDNFTVDDRRYFACVAHHIVVFMNDKTNDDYGLEMSLDAKVDIFKTFVVRLLSHVDVDWSANAKRIVDDLAEEYKKRMKAINEE